MPSKTCFPAPDGGGNRFPASTPQLLQENLPSFTPRNTDSASIQVRLQFRRHSKQSAFSLGTKSSHLPTPGRARLALFFSWAPFLYLWMSIQTLIAWMRG